MPGFIACHEQQQQWWQMVTAWNDIFSLVHYKNHSHHKSQQNAFAYAALCAISTESKGNGNNHNSSRDNKQAGSQDSGICKMH